MTMAHGSILGGVCAVPDLTAALADYHGRLGLRIVAEGPLEAGLARSWGVAGLAGAAMATLQPVSGHPCFVRLVEQPVPEDFRPTRTFGWAAYEFSVQDVYVWPDRLAGGGFTIVGPPKEIAGLPYFVPMQVTGTGREMLYLNEVRENTPSSDLPRAASPVDQIFIAILATGDPRGTLDWYLGRLGLDEGGTYDIDYTMLNAAFALTPGTHHKLTMVQSARLPILEVDAYPEAGAPRGRAPGHLPPGNALVALAVRDLDALTLDWMMPPHMQEGPVYNGARAATVLGPAGELLELIERATA